MTQSLGRMVGLLLVLYVFNEIVDVLWVESILTNQSKTFWDSISFIHTLFPVVGILAAFEIIYSALKTSGLA